MLAGVLEGDAVVVAGHFDEDATLEAGNQVFVVGQVGNRANRLRAEPEADAHRAGRERVRRQPPGDFDGGDDTRRVVIGLVRVADMRHNEHFTGGGGFPTARMNHRFGHFEPTLGRVGQKLGADDDPIVFLARQGVELVFAQAESP